MKIKIKIDVGNITDPSLAIKALQQLALDLSQSGPLFVGKKITIRDLDKAHEPELGALKVKE